MTDSNEDYLGEDTMPSSDTATIDLGYKHRADTVSAPKPYPSPGRYFLTYGQVTTEYDPGRSGTSKAGNAYSIGPSVKASPNFSIAGTEDGDDTFAGTALTRFYELTSAPCRAWDRLEKRFVERNFSTLSGAVEMQGLALPDDGNVAAIRAVAESLSGMTTPKAVYLTLVGKIGKDGGAWAYKTFFKRVDGTSFNLNERAFRRGEGTLKLADYKASGGTWARVGYVLNFDTEPSWSLSRPELSVPHVKVFADLVPTDDAWKPQG